MKNQHRKSRFQQTMMDRVGKLEENRPKELFWFFFFWAFLPAVGGRLKLKDAKSFSPFGILLRLKELVA